MRQSIKIALVIAWVAISVFLNYGCRQTIMYRTIITTDPNGVTTIDHVHLGATSIGTDTELDGLVIESDKGQIALDRAVSKEDSIKASAVIGGVPVIIETK